MAQSVVIKKQEKVEKLFNYYGLNISLQEFKDYFKSDYPKDWERIQKRYKEQVLNPREKGKKEGPMPHPEKYLENMYKVSKHS
ncbi:hypothetical protein [Mammaliicoccus sciuri]|uniref:hypothetical protein n=1 Tax=Mammaliicoccus sciuri TaxID=1296 RepID=UPI0019509868|nr:hypothetical protein [Mammaliicoccus sciuri]